MDAGCFLKIPGERKLLTAKYYGTTSQKQNLTCAEDVEKVKKELEGAAYQVTDVKKGERVKKSASSVYHIHAAAGSQQGAEFFHPENNASCTAAI